MILLILLFLLLTLSPMANITHFKPKEFFVSSDYPQLVELPKNFVIYENILEIAKVLDEIRSVTGFAIQITSGYRPEALNKAVGGVWNSLHLLGRAVDFRPCVGCTTSFRRTVVEFLGFTFKSGATPSRTITYKNAKYELVDYGNRLHLGLRIP